MKKAISMLCVATILFSLLSGCAVYDDVAIPKDGKNLAIGANANLLLKNDKKKDYSKAIDSNAKTGTTSGVTKGTIEVDLGKVQTFNTIVLREKGWNVRQFHIDVLVGENNWETVYQADRIEAVRYCAIDKPITTSKIRVIIDSSNQPFTIGEIEVYNQLATTNRDEFTVIGYVRTDFLLKELVFDKNSNGYLPVEYFNSVTELNFLGGINLTKEGNISVSMDNEETSDESDTITISIEEFGAQIKKLRQYIGDKKVQMTATVINGNHDEMLEAIRENKDNTIKKTVEFLNSAGLDGVSYDWERPQNKEQYDAFSDYLIELKPELMKADKRLTLAWAPWGISMKPEAVKTADAIEIMTYDLFDQYGNQASFTESTVQAIKYFTDLGYEKKQLHIGIPYYGRPDNGSEYWPSYDDENYHFSKYTDMDSDYLSDGGLSYFNSCQTTADKTAYALSEGVGGIMVFRLELDRPYESDTCITKSIEKVLDQRTISGGTKQ